MSEMWHDAQRDLLVYRNHAGAPLDVLSDARVVNGSYFAVPRTLRNSQILRHYQYPVLPIMDDYDYPRMPGITPYAKQKLMSEFLVLHPRSFNLSDLGTGKTLAALWAADWLMRQHPRGKFRALICAPLSLLQRVWADAIFQNFLNRRTFAILHGDASRREDLLEKDVDFYIVNHDGVKVGAHPRTKRARMVLSGFCEALSQRKDIQLAIVDEAAAFRDASSDRHHAAREVLGKRPYLWLMTATPTPNAPTDAYGLAKLVNNAWGKAFTSFRQDTMLQFGLYKWVPRKDGYDKARALLQPAIRVDISEVWDAPPTTTQQRQVELTPEQTRLIAQLKRDLQVTVKSGTITAMNEAAARTKFIQICGGAIYDDDHLAHSIDCEPRLREVEAVAEQTSRKIVLFASLTSIVDLIYKRLSKRWKCEILNGAVTPRRRAEIIKQFETDDELRIIVADPQTTAHGINEFALVADTVMWATPTDKNELYIQGNGRVNRPGQKYPTTIVQLVSTKLEREIFARLATNTSLQGALLDAIQRGEI